MTIRDEIIDELLSGEDPQAVFAKDGLLEALKKALDAGCDAHVAKPVKKATLLAAVHKAIGDLEGYDDGTHA